MTKKQAKLGMKVSILVDYVGMRSGEIVQLLNGSASVQLDANGFDAGKVYDVAYCDLLLEWN